MLRNTCANGILVNQSNKHKYFKGIMILQKLLIKQLNRNLSNSVNSHLL